MYNYNRIISKKLYLCNHNNLSFALTFDLENRQRIFYHQVTGKWKDYSEDFISDVNRILYMLDKHDIKATFFCVGKDAVDFPNIIKKIDHNGHEIGCHSYSHKLFIHMSEYEFKNDVSQSRKILQDISGQPVFGFRAPEFTIGNFKNTSFFDVLIKAGFRYDSSVFPVGGTRYGIHEAPEDPFVIETASGSIREYPLATWTFREKRLPIAGGSYYRFLPISLIRYALNNIKSNRRMAVLYFHPYEFHHGTLYLPYLSHWKEYRRYVNQKYFKYLLLHNLFSSMIANRLDALLNLHTFLPLGDIYNHECASE